MPLSKKYVNRVQDEIARRDAEYVALGLGSGIWAARVQKAQDDVYAARLDGETVEYVQDVFKNKINVTIDGVTLNYAPVPAHLITPENA